MVAALAPPTDSSPPTPGPPASRVEAPPPTGIWLALTLAVLVLPVAAVFLAACNAVSGGLQWRDVALGAVLFVVSGLGITAGFHRLFTHRAFVANRPLKIAFALAGTLAFEGSLSAWVANHRVHHARSDQPGDPHSPFASYRADGERYDHAGWRGFWHAHCLWLVRAGGADEAANAPDILADKDLHLISTLFGPIALSGIVGPFLFGWILGGDITDGAWCAVWAGGVRILLLHHITWSINSACHLFGRRDFATGDRSSNVWWLALPSFGESWHNAHHMWPCLARHGVGRAQIDLTAALIGWCERRGWATKVRWPSAKVRATAAAARSARR
jgi:stearoyl-CoA desaturase (delta-9 desaturase)